MFAVPLYAIGWLLAQNIRNQRKRPLRSSVYELYRRGVAQFPFFANETAAFAASGFLGSVLAVIVPRAPVQAALTAIAAGPGVIAAGLALIVFVLAGLRRVPVISVSILAGTVSAVGMPGLSPQLLALALGGAWGVHCRLWSLAAEHGGFKWSSQHGLCGLFGGTGPEPRPVFSSPGSFAACC